MGGWVDGWMLYTHLIINAGQYRYIHKLASPETC